MKSLRIGEVAALTDVGIETIRFYERKGLLNAPARKASGYRQFDKSSVARIHFIKRAKALGFTLKEIRGLLQLTEDESSDRSEILAKAKAKIDDIDSKISDLVRIRESLGLLVSKCHGSGPLSDCPIVEALQFDHHKKPTSSFQVKDRSDADN